MAWFTRPEKNALWFGLGALLVICVIVATAFLPNPNCNVAYIPLQGDLVTYPSEFGGAIGQKSTTSSIQAKSPDTTSSASTIDSFGMGVTASEDVTKAIRDANDNQGMKAIVLEIDSPGGSPVAGEEIANALRLSNKPTIALIRDEGDSAAYMAATGASKIYASQFSDVGDIGITASFTDQSKQDETEGITFNQLSIGKYKDFGNPDKAVTPDEKALAMSNLQEFYQDFVGLVAANRHLSTTTVTTLANGSGITAQDALADGLIDNVGGYEDVVHYLSDKLHNKAVMCGM